MCLIFFLSSDNNVCSCSFTEKIKIMRKKKSLLVSLRLPRHGSYVHGSLEVFKYYQLILLSLKWQNALV